MEERLDALLWRVRAVEWQHWRFSVSRMSSVQIINEVVVAIAQLHYSHDRRQMLK
jgi:hypothetical protein